MRETIFFFNALTFIHFNKIHAPLNSYQLLPQAFHYILSYPILSDTGFFFYPFSSESNKRRKKSCHVINTNFVLIYIYNCIHNYIISQLIKYHNHLNYKYLKKLENNKKHYLISFSFFISCSK